MPKTASVFAATLLTIFTAAAMALGAPPPDAGSTPQGTPAPSNPFPSPSPVPSPSPTINGYGAAMLDAVSASGGTYVPAGSTSPPIAFPSTGGRGFTLDVTGKFSRTFGASLRLQDESLHGGDRPLVTTTEGALLYDPLGARVWFGLSYLSLQRSSGVLSATGGGIGGAFLPDTTRHISAYGKLFLYPSVSFPQLNAQPPTAQPTHASVFTYQAGVAVAPAGGGGLFFTLAVGGHGGGPRDYSPQSVSALQLGIGTTF